MRILSCLLVGMLPVLGFSAEPEKDLAAFLGANLGYTNVRPAAGTRESDRDGYAIHVKGLFSKYFENWVADLGLGYMQHYASGADQFSLLNQATVKVKTRAGFVEFSPRYRLDEHHQLGLVLNGFFGTDVGLNESMTGPNQTFALAGGGRYDWETVFPGHQRFRLGFEIMHDLTIQNRGVWWAMADIQFGFPLHFGGGKSGEAPGEATKRVTEVHSRPAAPKFAEITPEKAVKIYLGEAVLRFKTASAELRPSSRQILEKVSTYLKQAPTGAWEKIRVEGHADRRGPLEYNMHLSQKRAERVKSELTNLGLPVAKLTAKGFGPNRPIDPSDDLESYALNRRVELSIDGVQDPEALARDLNELK